MDQESLGEEVRLSVEERRPDRAPLLQCDRLGKADEGEPATTTHTIEV